MRIRCLRLLPAVLLTLAPVGCSRAPQQPPPAPPTLATRVRERGLKPRVVVVRHAAFSRLAWVGTQPRLAAQWVADPNIQAYQPVVGFVSATTGALDPLYDASGHGPGPARFVISPAPSHDGRTLAMADFGELPWRAAPIRARLLLRSLAHGTEKRPAEDLGASFLTEIAWASGDNRLYLSQAYHPADPLPPSGRVLRIDADGRNRVDLFDREGCGLANSPDDRHLAFAVSPPAPQSRWEIRVINPETSAPESALSDAWSPSWRGEELWYVSGDQPDPHVTLPHGFGRAVSRCTRAGAGAPQVIATAPQGRRITRAEMAPDGSGLWALMDDSSLWLLNADGKEWLQLDAHAECPAWSPDSAHLAWAEPEPQMARGEPGLYVLDLSP